VFPSWRSAFGIRFVGYDLERHPEDFGDLFGEQPCFRQLVTGSAKTSADHLFTKQLRHEWAQSDDVRDRVAVPTFREHSDADDAPDVPTRWIKRLLHFLSEFFKSFGIDRPSLRIWGPRQAS